MIFSYYSIESHVISSVWQEIKLVSRENVSYNVFNAFDGGIVIIFHIIFYEL